MLDVKKPAHAHEDDLELYVRGRLEPAQTAAVEAHLLECKECRARLAQCIGVQVMLNPTGKGKPAEENQRSEPRFQTGDAAEFQELHPLSVERQSVQVADVSKNGLGILAPQPVLPGTIVQVRIKGVVELGEVRHCTDDAPNGYRIGLRLRTGS